MLTSEEVLAAHKEMAASFGNQPQQIMAAARVRAQQQEQQPSSTTKAKEAITFARDSIFEREAVADERTILRDALRRGMGEATYREIRTEFDRRQEGGEFRFVEGPKHSSGRSFTTAETIAAERSNIRIVLEGRNAVEPIMSAERAQEKANTRSFLNPWQRRVVEEVLNSSIVSTACRGSREPARRRPFRPSAKARKRMDTSSKDLHQLPRQQGSSARPESTPRLFRAFSREVRLTRLPILPVGIFTCWTSPALPVPGRCARSLSKLNPDDRVLVIGDTRQHQGVDAGRPFQQMQEAGMQTSQLDKIMRQKNPDLLKAVQHLANHDTAKGIAMLIDQGRVTEISNGVARIAAIAKDYAAIPRTRSSSPRTTGVGNRSTRQFAWSC